MSWVSWSNPAARINGGDRMARFVDNAVGAFWTLVFGAALVGGFARGVELIRDIAGALL